VAPLAAFWIVALGWGNAMQAVGLIVLLALPAAWVLRGSGARESIAFGGCPRAQRPASWQTASC